MEVKNTLEAFQIVIAVILGVLSSMTVVFVFFKNSKDFNPFVKVKERLDDHDSKIDKNRENIEKNKDKIDEVYDKLDAHVQENRDESYILLQSISALLKYTINPNDNKKDLEQASQQLNEHLYRK